MIRQNLEDIIGNIPQNVTLIAVSKTKPFAMLKEAYDAGQRDFGENRCDELVEKHDALPSDIRWHMIGHLQSKKVKTIAAFVHLIQSVDSLSLLQEIEKQASKSSRVIDCLLQFHIADEESKYGFSEQEAEALLTSGEFKMLSHVRIVGVMGMATFTSDQRKVSDEFCHLRKIFNKLKASHFASQVSFNEISMGMSGDYLLAIQQGSTMIRVGSSIFGDRN